MKKLLSAALALLCVGLAVAPALAQVTTYTDVSPTGERISVPVTPAKPLPVTGTISASTSATAASTCTPVTAGTGKAVSEGLFGNLCMTPVTPTGTYVDLSLPSVVAGIDGLTAASTANPVPVAGPVNVAAAATGGCALSGTQSAASTNATSVKASAGTLCGGHGINTTGTIYYLRFYNLSTAPTPSSAAGYVLTVPIPANTSGAGVLLDFGPFGAAFTTGIAFAITGGPSSTDNAPAATGVFVNLAFK